jgi:hypothetical protein
MKRRMAAAAISASAKITEIDYEGGGEKYRKTEMPKKNINIEEK